MKLTIVLPCYPTRPIGGLKVQYEYANRLVARGHEVSLVHPRTIDGPQGWLDYVKAGLWPMKVRWQDRPPIRWFPLAPQVDVRLVRRLAPRHLPKADAIVATSWRTAEVVRQLGPRWGQQYYVVYDYEFWRTESPLIRERMASTFRAGMRNIATSTAVKGMLHECGAEAAAYIPPGLDLTVFRVETPVDARDPLVVGFPVRQEPHKGTADVLDALRIMRDKVEGLVAIGFGSPPPDDLPSWVRMCPAPTDRALSAFYNSISLFLYPSHFEGWGLPGAEALACGACLVAADSVGIRDYAVSDETAVLVPPRRPEALAAAALELIRDPDRRRRLAVAGRRRIADYSWDRSVDRLERLLISDMSGGRGG